MRLAIIGCGATGARRGGAITAVKGAELAVCVDVNQDRAEDLAARYGCLASTNVEDAISRPGLDGIVIATSPYTHADIAIAAAQHGRHIFCESPLARSYTEAEHIAAVAESAGVRLMVSAVHRRRQHAAKAYDLLRAGAIGAVVSARATTGVSRWEPAGDTWFASIEMSGGGVLMENGIEALDLGAWIMGDFVEAFGWKATNVLPIEPCEDNAFGLFKTVDGRIFSVHSSWTQWMKSLIVEVSGTDGYIVIDYDWATTTLGSRSDPAIQEVFDFSAQTDTSWTLEIEEFVSAVDEGREPSPGAPDALRVLRMAAALYTSSDAGCVVRV